MARAYKITEVCGDWALHIPPYGKTDAEMILIFNSRNNAELVKSVLEWEDAHPNAAVPYKSTLAPPNEAPPCYQPDGDGCAYQCYDGDDEPIDKCKECPLCYSDKQRHHAPPNEWVSVEERLPEYNPGTGAKSYWVAKKDNAGNWQMKIAQYCDYGYAMTMDAETEVTWRDWDFTKIVNVTHWMPLPAPPERRNSNENN